VACAPPADGARVARSTLVIGIDVSGSFRGKAHYESAIDFTANYLYAHIHGLGGLKQPTAVFVGSFGGEKPGETKSFQPIDTFRNMSVAQIAAFLRKEYPSNDGLTDFNPFFERVGTLVKRQNLILAPLNIVMFSDGMPDIPGASRMSADQLYGKVDLSPLEFLSRSVTVRLLYATPSIAQHWERRVKRTRVRIWTQDSQVMQGWRRFVAAGLPPERQDSLWSWTDKIVDFRVRRQKIL